MAITSSSIAIYTPASRTRLAVPVQRSKDIENQRAVVVQDSPVQDKTANPVQGELLQRTAGPYETTQSYLASRSLNHASSSRYMVDRYIRQEEIGRKQDKEDHSINYYV